MSNLNDIVNVSIDLMSPATDSTSFSHVLIVGEAPATGIVGPVSSVGMYTSLTEVQDAGWKTTGDLADPVGIAAMVAFSQSPQPDKIYIAVIGEGEDPTDALDRALSYSGWYVVCPAGINESEFEDIAKWTEAQEKTFAFPAMSATPTVGAVYYRSFGIFCKETFDQEEADIPSSNLYAHVAFAAKCLYYDPGSETWALKQLSVIYPARLSGTEMKALQDANISYYTEYAGKNITQGAKVMAGEWIDVIRFRDWLKNDMQLSIYNLLITNPKIPYTNRGIALVENQMIASLKRGINAGGIAPDEYDSDGNLVSAFKVKVPNSIDLTDAQKASRILTGCKFWARIAGAIHAVNVKGSLVYSYQGV